MRVSSLLSAFLLGSSMLIAPSSVFAKFVGDGTEAYCHLNSLTFTNGLKLSSAFSPTTFHYYCQCDDFANNLAYSTQVHPVLADNGSTAEITFNGKAINNKAMGNAISNDGTVAKSPLTSSSPLLFANGANNVITVGVSCNGEGLPSPCYYEYIVECQKPGGGVNGDPQFSGLRGQNYQVHGVAGEVYNIISDRTMQENALFTFLNKGECPVVNGKKQKNCWSHPGSYLGEVGLITNGGDKVKLVSGSAKQGFASVEVNGAPLTGSLTLNNGFSVHVNSTHAVTLAGPTFTIDFENSDMFINQAIAVNNIDNINAHGLLGQTWSMKTHSGAIKEIEGEVDDYLVTEKDLFGYNYVFNRYN